MDNKYDVIVVGAGIGGATCAALLARRGVRTLVIDKNAVPGGKAITMDRQGFRYELWPISGGPSLGSRFAEVLAELDMQSEVELLAPEQAVAMMYRGQGSDGYRRCVMPAVPSEQGPAALLDLLSIAADDLPEAARLFADITEMSSDQIDALDDVTFADFLARYRLPTSLLSYLGMWSNIVFVVPIDLLAASEAIRTYQDFNRGGAARYHSGGFGRVAEVFCRGVERYGGRVLMKTRVQRILVADGTVTGVATDNGTFHAPIVVSNAGIQPTVLKLVGEEHFDKAYTGYVKGLLPSLGIMGIRYFLNEPFFEYPMYLTFADDSALDTARLAALQVGRVPQEPVVFNVVPARYDSSLAPPGKQCALVGTLCAAAPDLAYADALWERLDATVERLWPGLHACVESSERYSTRHVSALTRDAVVPGCGGECVGLGQIVGQCGRHKPAARTAMRGLFLVGCDAGGYGCGTHQAADSGVKVADMVMRERLVRTLVS